MTSQGLLVLGATLALSLAAFNGCSSPPTTNVADADIGDAAGGCGSGLLGIDASAAKISMCFPDHDGLNGGTSVIHLTVDDTEFSVGGMQKTVIATQNDATAILTLTNKGTKPHGFEVGCVSVFSGDPPAYTSVPKGCPTIACFPSNSVIAPIEPGASKTITFATPTPDGLVFPVRSSDPADCSVPGLNGSATDGTGWSLM